MNNEEAIKQYLDEIRAYLPRITDALERISPPPAGQRSGTAQGQAGKAVPGRPAMPQGLPRDPNEPNIRDMKF